MDIEYKVIFSKRKTLNISVERDKSIIVRAPENTAPEKIDKIIEAKKMWLYEKLHNTQKYSTAAEPKEFVSGESLMYLGKNYRLDVVADDFKDIQFNNKFIISKNCQPAASRLFKTWYYYKAKEKIIPKVRYYADRLGVKYNQVNIKNMQFRWGSCTPKDNLNFNWRLVKAPMSVIEYVIVHELAHLMESNHTQELWNIIAVQIPGYQKAKQWLKEHGELLEIDL